MHISRQMIITSWDWCKVRRQVDLALASHSEHRGTDQPGHCSGLVTNLQFFIYEMNGLHECFSLLHTWSLWTYMKTSMYYVFCLYILHLLKQGLLVPYWLVNVSFSIFSSAFVAERCPISYKHMCSYSVLPHFMFR